MKLDHTPGPWEYGKPTGSNGFYYIDSEGQTRGSICTAYGSIDKDIQTKANARLIASAPAMLEALIELYRGLYGNYEPAMQSEDEAKRELQSVIESATGKKIEEVLAYNRNGEAHHG